MDVRDRLREVRVTGAIAVCFGSLLLGLPFAVAWSMDDGSGNQPFPRGLRRLVLVAAALHFGSVSWRLVKAAWTWEPVLPIAGKLIAAYALLAATFAAGWALHAYGVRPLTHLLLAAPGGWGCYFLGRAMTPPAEPPNAPAT